MIAVRLGESRLQKLVGASALSGVGGCVRLVLGMTMRICVLGTLGFFLVAGVLPCAAQSIRMAEPLILAPYETALVQDGSCSVGKVLKVTGAIRGLRRKKLCIPLGEIQASLGSTIQ
jgi:hypothetical protein